MTGDRTHKARLLPVRELPVVKKRRVRDHLSARMLAVPRAFQVCDQCFQARDFEVELRVWGVAVDDEHSIALVSQHRIATRAYVSKKSNKEIRLGSRTLWRVGPVLHRSLSR